MPQLAAAPVETEGAVAPLAMAVAREGLVAPSATEVGTAGAVDRKSVV